MVLHLPEDFGYLFAGYLLAVVAAAEAHHFAYLFLENETQLAVTDFLVGIQLVQQLFPVDIVGYAGWQLRPFAEPFNSLDVFL